MLAKLVSAMLIGVSLWQFNEGLWIYCKAHLAQHLIAQAWHTSVNTENKNNVGVKPWPYADTWPVAKLIAPQHKETLYVLAGAQGNSLAFGPGHLFGTALPGTPGTSIIGGHRDTHFKFLKNLKLRDRIIVENIQKQKTRYQVNKIEIMDSRHDSLSDQNHNNTLILVSCYPFDAVIPGGPMRYVVYLNPLHD